MTAVDELAFQPLLPWWATALVLTLLVAAAALVLWRRPRAAPARLALVLAAAAILLNPVQREEVRAGRPDVAVAVVDQSASMQVGDRRAQVERALARLRQASPGVVWQVAQAPGTPGGRTRVAPAVERALGGVPADRLAGVVLLTDGITADPPESPALPAGTPLHVVLGGDQSLRDRRLIVEHVPPYSISGQPAEIRVRVDDGPQGRGEARIDWQVDGKPQPPLTAVVGEPLEIRVPISRRGPIEVALAASPLAEEATLVNNRALARLNGVRDRLRVLLVSGVPYPGGRVWRDILRSDDNIDLVHFTILRLPSSYDPTPPDELALIPFPVEELFDRRLSSFDLIIFDRFGLTELLSPAYLARVGDHVRRGGGMLVVTGEEFSQPGGLAVSAVADVLPARSGGAAIDERFVPQLTDRGQRHPVTATLRSAWPGPRWGAWGEQAVVEPVESAEVLMTGADQRPLLVLGHVGEGRVGLLASTNVWWWARGVEGGGPREVLLRRLAHWLMKEPDLAEDRLEVTAAGRRLTVTARGREAPSAASITAPDGKTRTIALDTTAEGVSRASVSVAADGLHRVEAGGLARWVLAGETAEFAELRPRANPLQHWAESTGGGVFWLANGVPNVRRVDRGDEAAGRNWLGLARGSGGEIVAVRSEPVIPNWAAFALLAGLLALAWWRERAR